MSSHPRTYRAMISHAVLAAAFVGITGCTTLSRSHGFVPLPEDLAQMAVGTTTRADVVELVGQPTAGGVIGDDTLYYVKSERENFGPFEPTETSREVVAISFNPGGTLRNIEKFGLQDGRTVALSRRITDDGIADLTFIGQLLGAVGQIDAGQFLGGPLGGSDDN